MESWPLRFARGPPRFSDAFHRDPPAFLSWRINTIEDDEFCLFFWVGVLHFAHNGLLEPPTYQFLSSLLHHPHWIDLSPIALSNCGNTRPDPESCSAIPILNKTIHTTSMSLVAMVPWNECIMFSKIEFGRFLTTQRPLATREIANLVWNR